MSQRIIELRRERSRLITQARELNDKVQAEGRDFTAEEQEQWDRLMDEAEKKRQQAEREERLALAEEDMEPDSDSSDNDAPGRRRADPDRQPGQSDEERQMRAFERVFGSWLTQDFRAYSAQEWRALQADLDISGGYLRPPMQFVNELLKAIDDMAWIRQWARTFQVESAESMGAPTLETDPADADWTAELATGNEDSTMSFGRRELQPHPLAKRLKVSKKLIRAVPNSAELARDRLAYKFGITFEKACLTGNGVNQPLGVFTASSQGISTGRDVSEGNTATAVLFDGLIEAKYTLKAAYWPMARWLAHRDFWKMVAKLKDGEGQYLWRESVRVGEPDRCLGLPAFISEYAPNTFTASQYVGILGDFRNYWIADALTLEFQLLNELYAETNQVGLIGRLESDGMPVLEEAFVRVQLAA